MKISVVIPAYNCEASIRATLDSVLGQTVAADEILVMDDGSSDETYSIVKGYEPRIRALRQANSGAASTRNALCQLAQGEMLAFLDSDDIWHPEYLSVQRKLVGGHSEAVAFFTGHVDFCGYGAYQWKNSPVEAQIGAEIIAPLSFFRRYNKATGPFASMSYCCIPKRVLTELGTEPFRANRAEDSYLFNLLSLKGPVVYYSLPLVAYRVHEASFSTNRVKTLEALVEAFNLLKDRFESQPDADLARAFREAFAAKRREYSKLLLGANRIGEGREQLRRSLGEFLGPASLTRSIAILGLTYLPSRLQPTWPSSNRKWQACDQR